MNEGILGVAFDWAIDYPINEKIDPVVLKLGEGVAKKPTLCLVRYSSGLRQDVLIKQFGPDRPFVNLYDRCGSVTNILIFKHI